jgi:putative hydrolase of the HAD superfamily
LEYLGLSGYWDVVHSSEDCGKLKPHPLSFLRIAEAMSLPPENILYVGNSHTYDVTGAARAGMKTAWIKSVFQSGCHKKPAPDFSFTNYRQFNNFMLH